MPEAIRNAQSWLICKQPRLGTIGLVLLLCITGISCPFAMDMYTPAMPAMPEEFGTTAAVVNLTVTGFYLFFTLGMLIFGPMSDKWGRKPILVGGVVLFVVGSVLCASSVTIEMLIASRAIEALGAGAICAVSTAIVKDCLSPEKRTALLSILQILQVVGPVLAPLLGGILLQYFSWHANFIALAVFGTICLVLSLLFTESLPEEEKTEGSLLVPFKNMGGVFKNLSFMSFLVVMSFFSVAFMAYIASASYIYVQDFGLTAQQYSYFFAATAGISVLGPILYLQFEKHGMTARFFTTLIIVVSAAAAALIFVDAKASVWVFFGCMAIFALCEASVRPYSTNILLAQFDRDAGAASAVINFTANIFGVAGMLLISLWPVNEYVEGLGILIFASMFLAALVWGWLLNSKRVHIKELEKPEK